MYVAALLLVSTAVFSDPPEIESDVDEIQSRSFVLPLQKSQDDKERLASIRIYVSQDKGKTWQQVADCTPKNARVVYSAAKDGIYWFALQTLAKDGTTDPPDVDKLSPGRKVYVTSTWRAAKQNFD